jgi:peptidoglycan/LPS O-acetylase OafA/YrhL
MHQSIAPEEGMGTQSPREKLHGLQSLRAIAALVVLVFHVANHGAIRAVLGLDAAPLLGLQIAADCAVDCFFVLSGFIMVYTQGLARRSAAAFAGQRLARIVPLYWVTTLAFAAYVLAFETRQPWLGQLMATKNYLAGSMLFVSHFLGYRFPVVLPGWSLEYEMLFYTVFSAAILASRRHTLAITGAITGAVLAALAVAGALRPICVEFAIGAGIGVLWFRDLHRPLAAAMLLIAPAIVTAGLLADAYRLVDGDDWLRLVLCGLPMTALFLVALCSAQRQLPVLAALGECSYAIYVSHCAWLAAFVRFLYPLLPANGPLLLSAGIAWCLAGGVVMHHLVERRFDRLLRAGGGRPAPVSAPATAPASR